MRPDPRAEGERWLAQAERDLDDARFLTESGRHHLACYLAQQSAEKALKAVLYAAGDVLVLGHSVAELAKRAAAVRPELSSIVRAGPRSTSSMYRRATRTPSPAGSRQRRSTRRTPGAPSPTRRRS